MGRRNPISISTTVVAKARIFQEAMPFIKAYRGKIVVIKYGGAAMTAPELKASFEALEKDLDLAIQTARRCLQQMRDE